MSDIKLFKMNSEGVFELDSQSMAVEKSLQTLIEKHLDVFLGVRFLATESNRPSWYWRRGDHGYRCLLI